MSLADELATLVCKASYEDLSEDARHQLKLRVLDSLAYAIGALDGNPVRLVRRQIEDFGGKPHCTMTGVRVLLVIKQTALFLFIHSTTPIIPSTALPGHKVPLAP